MTGVTRWMVFRANSYGMRYVSRAHDLQPWLYTPQVHANGVASAITGAYASTATDYLNRTQAWRPLDIHPDWRTWDGATTEAKGSK